MALPLPSLQYVSPIYFTRHFLLTLVFTVLLCCTINGLIDYFMNRNSTDDFYLIDSKLSITILLFTFIMSFASFGGGADVQKRIKAGKCEAVACHALNDTCIKRFFFFPIGEPNWKCRLPLWIWWSLMVPGVGTMFLLVLFAWAATGFGSITQTMCKTDLSMWVLWTEAWKGFVAAVLTTVHYAAAHNDEQPELHEGGVVDLGTHSDALYSEVPKTVVAY